MFTLDISYLTTSNLPWFLDLTFQAPMQYCSLPCQTLLLSPVPSTSEYCFALVPSLHSFWSYFSTDLSNILGTYWPGEFIFQGLFFFPFYTVRGVLDARILKWFAIPFSSGPHSVRPLHHDPLVLGCPAGMAFFIELEKPVVLVWLHWLVFCEYGFSASALWCPLATPTILLGFLLPWTWDISSQLLQQSTATAPYLGWWVSPHCHPSWLSTLSQFGTSPTFHVQF